MRLQETPRAPRLAATAIPLLALVACGPVAPAKPSDSAGSPTATPPAPALPTATVTVATGPPPALLELGGPAPEESWFGSLVSTPDGFLTIGVDGKVVIRGSADGSRWERLDAERAFGGSIDQVVAGPAGWIAAQRVETPTGVGVGTVLWHSSDGHSWDAVSDQAALRASFPGPLTAGPWGYAMAGQVIDGSGTSVPAAWTSRDGRTWYGSDPSGGGSAFQLQLFVTATGVIASLGDGRLSVTESGTSWSEPVEDPRLVDALIGLGPDGSSLLVTSATDRGVVVKTVAVHVANAVLALTWRGVEARGLTGAGVTGLASGPGRALLLGYDLQTLAPRTWTSADAISWTRTDLETATFGGGVPAVAAVGERAFVAIGWEHAEGGSMRGQPWTSLDGRTWSPADAAAFGDLAAAPRPTCPSAEPTDILGMRAIAGPDDPDAARAWLACFGDDTLRLEGWVQGCFECGGIDTSVGSPAWLMNPNDYSPFWLADTSDLEGTTIRLGVRIDPDRPLDVPPSGSRVRVTGHFGDPASETCRLIPRPGTFQAVTPAAATIARCRQTFVAEAIRVIN